MPSPSPELMFRGFLSGETLTNVKQRFNVKVKFTTWGRSHCHCGLFQWGIKNLCSMQETGFSVDWEDSLEEEMATHSSILAWRIPWTEEPGGL